MSGLTKEREVAVQNRHLRQRLQAQQYNSQPRHKWRSGRRRQAVGARSIGIYLRDESNEPN
ncbi:hypothetical protein EJB05_33902, partial [Eragrostis curvula]